MKASLSTQSDARPADTDRLPQQLHTLPTLHSTRSGPNRLRNRHVLIVGGDSNPVRAGTAPSAAELGEHLATRAKSVSVLTEPAHFWHDVLLGQGATPRAIYELTVMTTTWLARHRRRADLVIAVTPAPGSAVAARIAQRHDAPLLVLAEPVAGAVTENSGLTRRLERYALHRAERVVVISETARTAVAGYGVPRHRISVIPDSTAARTTQLDAIDEIIDAIFPDPVFSLSQTTRRP
jgi:hypothetical protein